MTYIDFFDCEFGNPYRRSRPFISGAIATSIAVAAGVSAVGGCISAGVSAASQASANATNDENFHESLEFNAEEAQKSRDFQQQQAEQQRFWQTQDNAFNAMEAVKNREWQEQFANQIIDKQNEYNSASAQVQRMKEAGLNPATLTGAGDAYTGGVSSGSTASANPTPGTPAGAQASVGANSNTAQAFDASAIAQIGHSAASLIEAQSGAYLKNEQAKSELLNQSLKKIEIEKDPILKDAEISSLLSNAHKSEVDAIAGRYAISLHERELWNSFNEQATQQVTAMLHGQAGAAETISALGTRLSELQANCNQFTSNLDMQKVIESYKAGGSLNKRSIAETLDQHGWSDFKNSGYTNSKGAKGYVETGVSFGPAIKASAGLEVSASETSTTSDGSSHTNTSQFGHTSSEDILGQKLENGEMTHRLMKVLAVSSFIQRSDFPANLLNEAYEELKRIESQFMFDFPQLINQRTDELYDNAQQKTAGIINSFLK